MTAVAQLLMPATKFDIVCEQLLAWIDAKILSGAVQDADARDARPCHKLAAMKEAQMPDAVMRQAVGRVLRDFVPTAEAMKKLSDTDQQKVQQQSRQYLEALAYVGLIPHRQWLKEALGFSVPADNSAA